MNGRAFNASGVERVSGRIQGGSLSIELGLHLDNVSKKERKTEREEIADIKPAMFQTTEPGDYRSS